MHDFYQSKVARHTFKTMYQRFEFCKVLLFSQAHKGFPGNSDVITEAVYLFDQLMFGAPQTLATGPVNKQSFFRFRAHCQRTTLNPQHPGNLIAQYREVDGFIGKAFHAGLTGRFFILSQYAGG